MDSFVARYDRLIDQPLFREIYGESGFFNVGLWSGATRSLPDACGALVDAVLGRLPDGVGRVLEIGAGAGGAAHRAALARPAAGWLAADLSLSRLQQLRRRASAARALCLDARRLGVAAASLDAVVAIEAAFHFDRREDFLAEAHRALRPGGALLLTDLLLSPAHRIGDWLVPPANLVTSVEEYRETLTAAGFAPLELLDWTDATWRPYMRLLRQHLERSAAGGGLAEERLAAARSEHDALAEEGVVGYFLVNARRCAARPGRG